MAGVPSGGNPVKNIIIGVVTTVIAYVIVHFLFDKKKGNDDLEKSKLATENAWNSVNEYISYAKDKFKTIACFSCDVQVMKKELLRELDNSSNNLKNLKQTDNIDERMMAVIDRTIQQFTDLKPVYAEYFDSLSYIKQLPLEEQMTEGSRIQMKYFDEIDHIQKRDSTEFNNYLRDVNKKYKTTFMLKEQQVEYKPEFLVGTWNIECTFDISFDRDGSLKWTETGSVFEGKWKLTNEKNENRSPSHVLRINLDNGQKFVYTIVILSAKMLVYYNPDNNSYLAGCPK